jgi:pyruvate formate lyase activating enzyme
MVFNVMRFSIHDGPGIRTTVFLKGCALRCPWCHNPESLSPRPELLYRADRCLLCGECVDECEQEAVRRVGTAIVTDADSCIRCGRCAEVCPTEAREWIGRTMSVQEVMQEVLQDVPFYTQSGGGLTVSGGEPFFQGEFLVELLSAAKRQRIHTAVDTTGSTSSELLARVARVADLFLYDIKCIDEVRHRELTGASNAPILENLRNLLAEGADVIVRVPVIPGANNSPEDVAALGAFLTSVRRPPPVHLLPYHRLALVKYGRLGGRSRMKETEPMSPDALGLIAQALRQRGLSVEIGR